MTKLRNLLLLVIGISVFILFLWLIALPDSVIKTTIENSISNNGRLNINPSIKSLRKGLFFTVYAESLELKIGKTTALIITDISSRINPLYLLKKQFAFSIRGKIGTGDIKGFFKLPESGSLKINKAEFSAIPYLASAGLQGKGLISARLNLKNNIMDAVFEIPDADIHSSTIAIPMPISSFRKIQGALQLQGNTIKITSISLDSDKGYARIKGEVMNGSINLTLELMPSAGKLEPIESMLISKYRISPGYYVIPVKGTLMFLPPKTISKS